MAFEIANTIGRPGTSKIREHEEEDKGSASAERRRLREAYERTGWLPGPKPSRATALKRKRAV